MRRRGLHSSSLFWGAIRGISGVIGEHAPDAEVVGGRIDAGLETVLGIVDALLPPLVSERAPHVVDVPRRPAGGGGGEEGVEEHDGAAVDKETELAAEDLARALLEVLEEVEEHLAGELDVVVGVHGGMGVRGASCSL